VRISFFGSSLVSAYWNGACTYYRGLIRALDDRGHEVSFYEPDAFDRQAHRDIVDPAYARVVVYDPSDVAGVRALVSAAAGDDVLVKASGVGVLDHELEEWVTGQAGTAQRIFWDVDAPATLSAMEAGEADRLRAVIGDFDLVLTYGGGQPVVDRYTRLGARRCVPIYNALDSSTHHPVCARGELFCDLALLANRLPDREQRVEEFFFGAARLAPERRFLLGGSGWEDRVRCAPNVRLLGHVVPGDHNAVNGSAFTVLNVSRDSMAAAGWSPATRVFEAAGAGACLISDAWAGIEDFLVPGEEVLVAHDGAEVVEILDGLDGVRARAVGQAALRRVLAEHTYDRRAEQVEALLTRAPA
jgi:spore maturation protein CgeB